MKVICYGDSNTWGYDPRGYFGGRYDCPWPELLGELTGWEVVNNGSCGQEIPRREVEFPADADLLIVMLGTNDQLQGATAREAGERMGKFLSDFDREKVLLLAPPVMTPGEWTTPAVIEESRKLMDAYRSLGVRTLDAGEWNIPMAYDGVHFTEEGHQIFAQRLKEALDHA